MRTPVSVAVAGLDEWGVRAARALSRLPGADLRWLCDGRAERPLRRSLPRPAAPVTERFADLLEDEMVDAVVVSAPLGARAMLVRRALDAGKHVLARSPLSTSGAEADELYALAERLNLRLLDAHEDTFDPSVQQLKRLIETGQLGDVLYLYGTRHRPNDAADVLWDVAADDVPVVLDLVGDEPLEVRAQGESYVAEGAFDVIVAQLRFATGISAHFHISLLGPRAAARLTVVGSQRLAILEDGRLTVHERIVRGDGSAAVRAESYDDAGLDPDDGLHRECEFFLSSTRTTLGLMPARPGAGVVHVLEALGRALASGGAQHVREAPRTAAVTSLSARRRASS